jgi:cytoskeleton protein RodZ
MSTAIRQPLGFGAPLRSAREARRQDLHTLAERLCLRSGVLKALEEERVDDLPEPLLARGYLRQYARLLGLDAEPLLSLYPAKTRRSPPTTVITPPRSRRKTWNLLFWRVLSGVAALAAVLWLVSRLVFR